MFVEPSRNSYILVRNELVIFIIIINNCIAPITRVIYTVERADILRINNYGLLNHSTSSRASAFVITRSVSSTFIAIAEEDFGNKVE